MPPAAWVLPFTGSIYQTFLNVDGGVALEEIDRFVYHQANARIVRAVGEKLELPTDRVVDCIAQYGNTSAATLPLALAYSEAEGGLRQGDRVLIAAFGAGFTWGATVVEWGSAA